jgi:hypothetical protein
VHHKIPLNLGGTWQMDNMITVRIKHHRSLEPKGYIKYNKLTREEKHNLLGLCVR